MQNHPRFFQALVCVAAFAAPQGLHASLIAYEPFLFDQTAPDASAGEYALDTDIRTQAPSTLGFSGAWSGTTSSFHARSQFPIPTNLPSDGGRLYFPGGSSDFNRNVERDLADYSGSSSSTYYFSVVARRDVWNSEAIYLGQGATVPPELMLSLSNNAKTEGVSIGYGFRTDAATIFPSLVVRAGGVDQLASGGSSTFNDAFTTVMRLDIDVSGTQDRLSWYTAIGPSNTTPLADFSTEASAMASADFLGVINAEIVSSQTAITELNVTSPTFSGITSFDEIRFATTWAEAVGVPEPSSMLLLALGMASLTSVSGHRKQRSGDKIGVSTGSTTT